jgi:hypothetical protein
VTQPGPLPLLKCQPGWSWGRETPGLSSWVLTACSPPSLGLTVHTALPGCTASMSSVTNGLEEDELWSNSSFSHKRGDISQTGLERQRGTKQGQKPRWTLAISFLDHSLAHGAPHLDRQPILQI